jgi:hypothetical protein
MLRTIWIFLLSFAIVSSAFLILLVGTNVFNALEDGRPIGLDVFRHLPVGMIVTGSALSALYVVLASRASWRARRIK